MSINRALYSSRSEEWETPQDLFDKLNARYTFDLDPAASHSNHKCARYFTPAEDGLYQSWNHARVFLNPPYGRTIGFWLHKCVLEYRYTGIIVVLIHARTDTRWWHESVMPHAHEIVLIKGRVRFVGSTSTSPFPSLLVIYRPDRPEGHVITCTSMDR